MYLYRGKDIGGRNRLHDLCRGIIQNGDPEELLEILPHLRVLRDPTLRSPLLRLLAEGRPLQKAAAVECLATLGDPALIPEFLAAFLNSYLEKGGEGSRIRAAVLTGLGDIPDEAAVDALRRIYREASAGSVEVPLMERLLIASLGRLAQQGIQSAEKWLFDFLTDGTPRQKALAATEAAVAYWHRPQQAPAVLLERLTALCQNEAGKVATAAYEALASLAGIGSRAAEECLKSLAQAGSSPVRR